MDCHAGLYTASTGAYLGRDHALANEYVYILCGSPIDIPVDVTVAESYWLYNILNVSMPCHRSPSEDVLSHCLGSCQTVLKTLRGLTLIFDIQLFRQAKSQVWRRAGELRYVCNSCLNLLRK